MIAHSAELLPAIDTSRGMTVLRYDFTEVPAGDDAPAGWRFHQVFVPIGSGRAEMIDAVIGERYTKADELALINNAAIDDAGAAEYAVYQKFRAQAKAWVDDALGGE